MVLVLLEGRDVVLHGAQTDRGGRLAGGHAGRCCGREQTLSGLCFQPARAFHADAVCRWLPGRWQLVLQVIELSSGSQNKIMALLLHTNEKCVTQLFRHSRSLFYACFGSGHCCKKKIQIRKPGPAVSTAPVNSFHPHLPLLAYSCL